MRKLLIVVAALVVVIIAAVVAAPFLIPVSVYKDQIEAQAKAATGRDLKIAGPMSLALFPSVAIEAKDVSFANAPGASAPEMARLKALQVSVKLMPLLRGSLEIDRFVLDEPVIVLEIDRQGRANWVLDGTARPQARPAAASGPSAAPGDIRLGELRLKNGRLTYLDARSGTKEELSQINATIDLPDLDRPMKLDGGAQWRGKALTLKLDVEKPRALMSGQTSGVTLALNGDPLKVGVKGQMAAGAQARIQGDVDLAVPSVRELAAWAGKPIEARPNTMGALAITGKLDLQGPKVAFTGARLSLDQIKGSGDLVVDAAAAKPRIQAKLALEKLDVNPYLGAEAKGGAAAGGSAQPAAGWSEEPIDLSALKLADADVDLAVGGLVVRAFEIGKGAIRTQLRDGKLTLDLSELALYQGNGQARVLLDGSGAVPVLDATIKLAGVQAEPILKAADATDRLSGTLAADAQIAGRGRSQKELVSVLGGKGQLRFTEGAIRGINLAALVRNIASAFTDPAAHHAQKTDFSEIGGTFTIDKGIVRNNDLALKSPLLRVEGKGTVDLPHRSLDYRIEPKAVMTTEGQGGQMQAAGIMVPVIVRGPWDNPTYQPDLAGLIRLDPSKALDALKGAIPIPTVPGAAQPGAAAPAPTNPLGTLRGLIRP
jgi:AsmA protein